MAAQRFNLPDGRYVFIEHKEELDSSKKVVIYTELAVYNPDEGVEIAVRGRRNRLSSRAREILVNVFGLAGQEHLVGELMKSLRVETEDGTLVAAVLGKWMNLSLQQREDGHWRAFGEHPDAGYLEAFGASRQEAIDAYARAAAERAR